MIGLAAAAFGYGLRHGFDWDHVAAITDICAGQRPRRRAAKLAMLYALGHAAVVVALGTIAITTGSLLPTSIDSVLGRIVGATLVVLGLTVLWSLVRDGRRFRLRSRWLLVFSGIYRGIHRLRALGRQRALVIDHDHLHEHRGVDRHDHPHGAAVPARVAVPTGTEAHPGTTATGGAPAPDGAHQHRHSHRHTLLVKDDPYATYGPFGATGVGMLHGVGVETPTQVLAFVVAVEAGSTAAGVALLLSWVLGLVVANAVLTLTAVTGFIDPERNFRAHLVLAVVIAGFSLILGTAYVLGLELPLPG